MLKILKDIPETPGVYCIKNTVNGKMYIGSSTRVRKRLRKHLQMLQSNRHHSTHLQNAWNLYGEKNFEFLLLSLATSETIVEVEQKFFDDCRPFHGENGYNTSIRASACVHTPESKEKLRQANLGKKYSETINRKKASCGEANGFYGKKHSLETKLKIYDAKPFVCVETGEVFNFHAEAAQKLNARNATISDCLLGKRYISNGLHFIHLDRVSKPIINGRVELTLEEKAEIIRNLDPHRRLFKCLNNDQIFSSVNIAARQLSIGRHGISDCLRGKISQTHGYQFAYV